MFVNLSLLLPNCSQETPFRIKLALVPKSDLRLCSTAPNSIHEAVRMNSIGIPGGVTRLLPWNRGKRRGLAGTL